MSVFVEQFIEKAANAGAEVKQFSRVHDGVDFLKDFFRNNKVNSGLISADLKRTNPFNKEFSHLGTKLPEGSLWVEAGIVAADYGVAETGTAVHFDRSDEEKNVWTLPEICFCFIERKKIVPNLGTLAPEISKHLARTDILSPQVSLVTGPSRTADIECQLTIGVHGPSRLIILLV
jgi:L-lactate dehydrogenase complex protein LldG